MKTVEIPHDTWSSTLNQFSSKHRGQPISVDVQDLEIGAQHEVHDLPLVGVVAEPREGHETIIVSAAKKKSVEHITHIVHEPSRVWIERTDNGTDMALQIESPGGTTIVRVGTSAD